jgi:flagellar hook-associated protein 2
MATINIGGIATGLDTNSIIEKLVALERRRAVDLLVVEQRDAQSRQSALGTFASKLATLKAAVDKLRDPTRALARTATSSDADVLGATAGSGALAGTTEITVDWLARSSIATSANGKSSADAVVAAGSGSFSFQVGDGDVQTVPIDGTTTLGGLATAINDLDAGVTATVVNLGTTAAPDYRLRVASRETGTENEITIVTDDTDLGVAVTQTARDAQFTVSGFATPFTRSSNVINDVIPGVTLTLKDSGGPVSVTVATDAEAVRTDVEAVVNAFNDLVAYVEQQSTVEQDASSSDRDVVSGPLAFDGTVRAIIEGLRTSISAAVEDLDETYSLLAEVGVTSTQDGRLALDADALEAALGSDEGGVAALFAGSGAAGGVFDRVYDYIAGVTQAGGLLETRTEGIATTLESLQSRIDAGELQVSAFEQNLRDTFTSLELLVSRLQSQSAFILSALGGRS